MTQQAQLQAEQAASLLGCDTAEFINPFDLGAAVSSKAAVFPPQKIVIYGTPGIGKTTFGSTFTRPFLLRTENGAAALDIPTFPLVAKTLEDVTAGLKSLFTTRHSYKTLIVDSLDWLEPLVLNAVCKANGKENIEDFGYGKGYIKADDEWRKVQGRLERLCSERGMNIITIAHAVAVTVDLPDLDPYQMYSLKLHKRAAALWMEWADMILFANYKAHVFKDSDSKGAKGKAKGDGERVIFTQERPAYKAKSRWPLDEEIRIGNDPTWSAFHENLKEVTDGAYHD